MPEWKLRELSSGPRLADTFVVSWSLNDGWQLFAPGLATPIAQSGQSIDNNGYWAAQRWAAAIILREGHKVTGWTDGFDPYGEEGYVPVLAEPLPVAEAEAPTEDVYLHVILDEAQDLSPMECRMIARRAAHASMTIVGDLGQATHPLAVTSWPELTQRLGKRSVRTLDLPTGYRVPQVIADFAARALAPGIELTRSFRPGGSLEIRQVDDLVAAVAQEHGGHRPRPPRRRAERHAGQPDQGSGVRPGRAGGTGRHRRRRAPRHEPALRRPDPGGRGAGHPAPSRCRPTLLSEVSMIDVIVAGGGPTGLMLACELRLHGSRCSCWRRRRSRPRYVRALFGLRTQHRGDGPAGSAGAVPRARKAVPDRRVLRRDREARPTGWTPRTRTFSPSRRPSPISS